MDSGGVHRLFESPESKIRQREDNVLTIASMTDDSQTGYRELNFKPVFCSMNSRQSFCCSGLAKSFVVNTMTE